MKSPAFALLRIAWPVATVASDGCHTMAHGVSCSAVDACDTECAMNFMVADYVTSKLGGLDHVGCVIVLSTFGKLQVALPLLMAKSSSTTEERTT